MLLMISFLHQIVSQIFLSLCLLKTYLLLPAVVLLQPVELSVVLLRSAKKSKLSVLLMSVRSLLLQASKCSERPLILLRLAIMSVYFSVVFRERKLSVVRFLLNLEQSILIQNSMVRFTF